MRLLRFLLKWLKRTFIFVVAVLFCGAIYNLYANHRDATLFPAPGRVVSVGDHQIHIDCAGQGSPTVVLESALGGPSLLWQPIKDKVLSSARVCSYDREGIGWSTDSGQARTAQRFATDLHQALAAAGEHGPLVLVGHSLGGMLVLNYSRFYPDDVAGVVLLDSTHPQQFEPGSEQWHDHQQALPIFRSGPLLARLGLLRFGLWMTDRLKPLPLPQHIRQEYIALASTPKAASAMKSEAVALFQLCHDSLPLPPLGEKPLVVLSAARSLEEGLPVRYHEEMAHLSSRGVHRVVPGASHSGIVLKPGPAQVSAEAIREVVDAVRNARPPR
jgi:pimeloyl-ACP methyl ester carboxylesterase